MRDLTRHRATLLGERTRQVRRLEKTLEDAQIKISSVLTDLLGASGRSIIEALIAGEQDPLALADRAKGRLRAGIPELVEALEGRFGERHAFLCRQHLRLIAELTALLEGLTGRVEQAARPAAFCQFSETATPGTMVPSLGQDRLAPLAPSALPQFRSFSRQDRRAH